MELEDGVQHTGAFASDKLTDEERDSVAPLVRSGHWCFKNSKRKLRERPSQYAMFGTVPPDPPAVKNPQLDDSAIPKDFNACQHLRAELERLASEKQIKLIIEKDGKAGTAPQLESPDVATSIAAVVRAINELFPQGEGFTFADHGGDIIYSCAKGASDTERVLDRVVLLLMGHGGQTTSQISGIDAKGKGKGPQKGNKDADDEEDKDHMLRVVFQHEENSLFSS